MQEVSKDWANDILQSIMQLLADENDKENGAGSTEGEFEKAKAEGGGGGGMNWLETLAEGMAKAQINWLNKADAHQATMQETSGKDDTASRDDFIMAQSKQTAAMQMFSMTAAATSTSLKTVGEGLAGIARKQ